MKKLTLVLAATFLATPALASDEFGSRFGDSTPYALNNDIGTAVSDVQGIDVSDLNDITPAAGDEAVDVDVEADVAVDAEADAEHGHDAEHAHDADAAADTDVEADVESDVDGDVAADVETDVEVEGDVEHGHDHSAE